MGIIQVPMEISDETMLGLDNGDFVRHGGVIYNKAGGIHEHLKDAKELPQEEMALLQDEIVLSQDEIVIDEVATRTSHNFSDLVSKSINYVSENKGKTSLIIGGTLFIGASVVYGLKKLAQNKKKTATIELVADTEFNEALRKYISAAKIGRLTLPVIVDLKEQLKKISKSDESNIVVIDVNQLQSLIGYIEKYTDDLAEVNNYQISDEQRGNITDDHIVNLTKYLAIQEDIFVKAG